MSSLYVIQYFKQAATATAELEEGFQAERNTWETEKTSLQNVILLKEAELNRLKTEDVRRSAQLVNSPTMDDERVRVFD